MDWIDLNAPLNASRIRAAGSTSENWICTAVPYSHSIGVAAIRQNSLQAIFDI